MSSSKFPDVLGEYGFIDLADPAVGVLLGWIPADDFVYRPLSVRIVLATDATPADRVVKVVMEVPGGGALIKIPSTVIQVASETKSYWATQGGFDPAPVSDDYTLHLPAVYLHPIDRLQIRCDNFQAGDQLSTIRISYLKWRL